jgi:hypothetical protein
LISYVVSFSATDRAFFAMLVAEASWVLVTGWGFSDGRCGFVQLVSWTSLSNIIA